MTIDETNVQPMITRREYMENSSFHHDYFLQFATKATFQVVLAGIGREKIADSTDPHMNDIPLKLWDKLPIKGTIKRSLKSNADWHGTKHEGAFTCSIADEVCIAKAVAREIKAGRESI